MVVGSCFAVARGILPISEPGMPRDAKSDSSGQLVDVDCVHGVNGRFRLPMVPMVKNESVDTETARLREALEANSVVDLSEFVAPAAGTVHGSCALCVSLSMHWRVRWVRQSASI